MICVVLVGDQLQRLLELRAAVGRVLHQALVLDDVEGRQRSGAGDRVRAVRTALRAGPRLLHQLGRRSDAGQREAGGQALRGDQYVRLRAEVVAAPELAGPPEPGLHLVDDEQDAVPVGALPQAGEEPLVGRHVAALAENRLDEERRGVGRRTQCLQHIVELAQREVGRLLDRPAEVARVGERRDVYAGHQRAEPGAELGPGRRHRGRRDGPAVEAAVEDDRRWAGRSPGGSVAAPPRSASLPELAKNIRSRSPGQHLAEPVDEREQRPVHDGRVLAWIILPTCSWAAATTRGWQCPVR